MANRSNPHRMRGGYTSSSRPADQLPSPPSGPAPGATKRTPMTDDELAAIKSMAEWIEHLEAEVRRLRAGIDAHQTTVLHAPPCRHCVSEVIYADKRLWSLVEDGPDG
jgi:hypothetical protein